MLAVISCAKKTYLCGLTADTALPIESKILKFEQQGVADTTVAFIRGNISGIHIHGNESLLEKLTLANFSATDKITDKTIGNVSDVNGNFSLILPATIYRFEIQFVGFNTLIFDNVKIGTGEIYEFNSLLGQGDSQTKYELKVDKSIIQVE